MLYIQIALGALLVLASGLLLRFIILTDLNSAPRSEPLAPAEPARRRPDRISRAA